MPEYTREERSALGAPCQEWTEFYRDNFDVVPVLKGSPEHMRAIMVVLKERAQRLVPPIKDGCSVRDVPMKTSDGTHIQLRIYTPTDEKSTSTSGICYIHGGGWTLGDLEGEDSACRAMCVCTPAIVVSVDYRLAPENPFPTGLNDAWEALNWMANEAQTLGVDAARIVVAGSSSGGNFAAALAHRASEAGFPLRGQVLRIPSVCHLDVYPPELNLHSLEELKDAPLLCKESMRTFWDYYNPTDPTSRDASPLLAASFEGRPPTYVQIAGMDPLRDEGLAYVEKLRDAGVPVQLDMYPGLPHAFGYFPELPQAAKNGADLVRGIQNLLAGKDDA